MTTTTSATNGEITESEASLMLKMFENDIIDGYRPPGIPHCNSINVVNQRINRGSTGRSNDDGGGGGGDDCSFANRNTLTDFADTTGQCRRRRPREEVQWVRNPNDGSFLKDRHGYPVSVGRLLATKPLNDELSSRRNSQGGKNLTYMAGSTVSMSLNYIFGQDGWKLVVKDVQQAGKDFNNAKQKFEVVYTAHVRLVHCLSGTYREEVGCCESTDGSYATAVGNAIKGSITDALKRSARHFGDKLGAALQNNGSLKKTDAPTTLQDALDLYDIERANSKFGCLYDPNKKAKKQQIGTDASSETSQKQKMNDLDPECGTSSGCTNTKQPLSNSTLPQQERQTENHVGQTPAFPSDSVSSSNTVAQQQRPQQKLQYRSIQGPGRAVQVSPYPSKASGHLNTTTPVKEAESILTYHDGQFHSPTFMSPSQYSLSIQKTSNQKGLVVTPSTSLSSSDQALTSRGRNPYDDVEVLDPVSSNQPHCCTAGTKRPEVLLHNTNSSTPYHQSSSHRPHKNARYYDSL